MTTEERRAYQRRYNQAHKKERAAWQKAYRDKRKEKIATYFKAWYKKQGPEWRQRHREKVKAYNKRKTKEKADGK